MAREFYTTKVLVEVEVLHQNDPKSGIRIVTDRLRFPAILGLKVISAESNYVLHEEPAKEMIKVEEIPNA